MHNPIIKEITSLTNWSSIDASLSVSWVITILVSNNEQITIIISIPKQSTKVLMMEMSYNLMNI